MVKGFRSASWSSRIFFLERVVDWIFDSHIENVCIARI
jgi:hypothetical protein